VRVKIAAAFVACVLLTCRAGASCPTVRPFSPEQSSPKIRLLVLFHQKPVEHARVFVRAFPDSPGDELPLYVLSDRKGLVNLPELLPGNYQIQTGIPGKLVAEIYVSVSAATKESTTFTMNLVPDLHHPFETVTSSQSIAALSGVVRDESGGAVPRVTVGVWRSGSETKIPVTTIHTDAEGHFSTHLHKGSYVALFSHPGFRRIITNFDVVPHADAKELSITLPLDACT
jgi:Carboxypeptidase regulatory-like domain